jgi:4-alpha-glucanotransferase
MNAAPADSLIDLARLHGVQPGYTSMSGEWQPAEREAIVATLKALGVATETQREIRDSLREWHRQHWTRLAEPVSVAWDRKPGGVGLHLPKRLVGKRVHCSLRLEDGTEKRFSIPIQSNRTLAEAHVDGHDYVATEIRLPVLPFGYHELTIEAGRGAARSLVISAPTKSFSRRGVRDWGAFLPLYAAHSKESWGAGNFSDWEKLATWIGSNGGKIVGTLPLLAAFLDQPTCDPSPYSPASRLFWNEFYLNIERVPEFAGCSAAQKLVRSAAFQKKLQRFRSSQFIDYRTEWALRRTVLELLARAFFGNSSPRRSAFEQFVDQRSELADYAAFRAACDRSKTSWHNWPESMRCGKLRSSDYDEGTKNFHLYVQWLAQEQIDQLMQHCQNRGVQFYLDLPLGVHSDGFDVWRERESFALSASAGAPPDSFFTKGQDWGFAPLHPQRIRERDYRHVLDYLRFQMRHTGLLRIDHVMGLHRLYWVPRGFSPAQGVYVSYPAKELYAILSLESHRNKTVLVGENLGTVPPEVNQSMKRHGLRGMFVVQYEQRSDSKMALNLPPTHSVASINTHDMPTFAAHWKGLEIADHAELGLISKNQIAAKRAARKKLGEALIQFFKREGVLKGEKDLRTVLRACLRWLGRSPAELVLVNLEDLLLETLPQNMPGTYRERPNWKRKAKLRLEQIFQHPEIDRALQELNRSRKK